MQACTTKLRLHSACSPSPTWKDKRNCPEPSNAQRTVACKKLGPTANWDSTTQLPTRSVPGVVMGLPIEPAGAHRQPHNFRTKIEGQQARFMTLQGVPAKAEPQNHRSLQFLALQWPQNQSPDFRNTENRTTRWGAHLDVAAFQHPGRRIASTIGLD